MTEPNRLRDTAPPNTYRTGVTRERARGTRDPSIDALGVSVRARPTSSRPAGVRWRGSRAGFLGGIVLAILGCPLFFAPGLPAEEAGIGMVCVGTGIAVAVVGRGMVANAIVEARRSKLAAVRVLLAAPHLVVVAAAGVGLIAFGLMVLAIAVGIL